jgi:hypothetical protein
MTLDEFLGEHPLRLYWAYGGMIIPPENTPPIVTMNLNIANKLIHVLLINKNNKKFAFAVPEPDEGISLEYLFKRFKAEIAWFETQDYKQFCSENKYDPGCPGSGQAFQFMLFIIQALKNFLGEDVFNTLHKNVQ